MNKLEQYINEVNRGLQTTLFNDSHIDEARLKAKRIRLTKAKVKVNRKTVNDEIRESYEERKAAEAAFTGPVYINPKAISSNPYNTMKYAELTTRGKSEDHVLDGTEKPLTLLQARMLAMTNCARPTMVNVHGVDMYVPCGKCVTCLAKRRNVWSKRLIDEREHPQCVYACGFTLTYDSEHIPYLTREELENGTYTYFQANKTHSYLNLHRGCNPMTLKTQENVGLLSNRDIDLFLKKVRRQIENKYSDVVETKAISKRSHKEVVKKTNKPYIFCRFFIAGEYGEADDLTKVDIQDARTARPHYHGIMYFFATSVEKATELKDQYAWNSFKCDLEQLILDAWPHAEQRWDPFKGIYYGKSIQVFGEGWGNYLGKYINKEVVSQFALGSKYIPEKCWCSRANPKYGLGSLGISSFFYDRRVLNLYLSELERCHKDGVSWTPVYNENGYVKILPRAYRNFLIQRYFGVKLWKVSQYIRRANLHSETDMYNYRIQGSFPIMPTKYLHQVKGYTQHSIACPPKYGKDVVFPLTEEIEINKGLTFSDEDIKYIERFIAFRDLQSSLYLKPFLEDNVNIGWIDYKKPGYQMNLATSDKTLDYKGWVCIQLRKQRMEEYADKVDDALAYKYKHAYKNGYIKRKGISIIVNS